MTTMEKEMRQFNVRAQSASASNGNGYSSASVEDAVEEMRIQVEQQVAATYQRAMAEARPQIAEPLFWWDIYAVGPIQFGATTTNVGGFSGPLLPHQVMRVGEFGLVFSVIALNPFFPTSGPSAAEILSNFALPFEVEYGTGDLKNWRRGPDYLQGLNKGQLSPGIPFAVDAFFFQAQDEGLFEMNICSRIYGCGGETAPPFAGYASVVTDLDQQMFAPGPRSQFDQSIRFQVYR